MNWFKKIFCKKIPFEADKNYLWIFEGISREKLIEISRVISEAKRKKTDIFSTKSIRLVPADSLVITFENQQPYKSKTQLLKAINKAIGNDFGNIGNINIGPEIITITKYIVRN